MKKSYVFIIFCVLSNFISQIYFDNIANEISAFQWSISNVLLLIKLLLTNIKFWIAIAFFGLSAMFWMFGIKVIPLSKAFSFLSLNYILIFLYSYFKLNEDVSINKLISCILIVLGVILISKNHNKNSDLQKFN